ncbi:hypothetical protein BLNAU_19323 [Blattamonas nauphoetae]|uniref:Uncharacterized protein n=1 Tax=Blattamonas nauphoetae TaxID=2049346 RepID=A0ABQ9X1W6_9EUKA|nr:hypothetical protein BLNAU_19323 [Blattamonas nauphoetae]
MCVSPNLHVDQRSKRCLVVLTSTLTTTDTVHTEEDDSSSKCYNSNDDDPTILPHDDLRSASFRESSGVTTHSRQPTRTIDTPSSDTVDVSNVEVAGEHGWAERWLSVFCLEQAELWLNIPTSHFPNWCLTMSTSSFTSASSIAGRLCVDVTSAVPRTNTSIGDSSSNAFARPANSRQHRPTLRCPPQRRYRSVLRRLRNRQSTPLARSMPACRLDGHSSRPTTTVGEDDAVCGEERRLSSELSSAPELPNCRPNHIIPSKQMLFRAFVMSVGSNEIGSTGDLKGQPLLVRPNRAIA